MKSIWKFSLDFTDEQTVSMPESADILSVQTQNGFPCVWALVEPDNKKCDRVFQIVGTGNPPPPDLGDFIGTFQTPPFVWHLFVKPEFY